MKEIKKVRVADRHMKAEIDIYESDPNEIWGMSGEEVTWYSVVFEDAREMKITGCAGRFSGIVYEGRLLEDNDEYEESLGYTEERDSFYGEWSVVCPKDGVKYTAVLVRDKKDAPYTE